MKIVKLTADQKMDVISRSLLPQMYMLRFFCNVAKLISKQKERFHDCKKIVYKIL